MLRDITKCPGDSDMGRGKGDWHVRQAPAHILEVCLTGPRVFRASKPRLLLPLIASL